jgi:hypothetical protein
MVNDNYSARRTRARDAARMCMCDDHTEIIRIVQTASRGVTPVLALTMFYRRIGNVAIEQLAALSTDGSLHLATGREQ